MDTIHVVIIGGAHHNTLGVIRSLGEESYKNIDMNVLLVGSNIKKRNFISQTKYIKRDRIDTVETSQAIIPWLIELGSDGIRRVIICCSDEVAETVISNKSFLSQHFVMPSTEMNVSDLMNKDIQSQIAIECGLNVPLGISVKRGQALDSEWNSFPCILKPIKSAVGAGKSDIRICNSKTEFIKNIESIEAEEIQIQQFLTKKMEYQLIGCSLSSGDILIIPGYTNIVRQPPNTNTGYLVYSPIKELDYQAEAVSKFIKTIGYNGLFSVEFIRDQNNIDYFLEINMRNDGNAYCVKSAGVNLPYIWCYYQMFGELPDVSTSFDKSVWFIPDFVDVRLGIKENGIGGWIRQFVTADSHAIFNLRDNKPFIFQSYQYMKNIINSVVAHK